MTCLLTVHFLTCGSGMFIFSHALHSLPSLSTQSNFLPITLFISFTSCKQSKNFPRGCFFPQKIYSAPLLQLLTVIMTVTCTYVVALFPHYNKNEVRKRPCLRLNTEKVVISQYLSRKLNTIIRSFANLKKIRTPTHATKLLKSINRINIQSRHQKIV